MNTFRFFTNVETLEDLRTQYKKLAMKYHPDRGGSTEDMQQINAEYEQLLKEVGPRRRNREGETYEKADYNPAADRFREIIDKIINFNITIEVCGCWIWITDGYEYRKELKELGFFWCSSKKKWAWSEEPTTNGFRVSMERIREMYGSEIVNKANRTPAKLTAANA